MTLGGKKLNFAISYKYLGYVICNDLLDEADIQANVRLLYAKSNMSRQKCHLFYCYKIVEKQIFSNLLLLITTPTGYEMYLGR